MRKSKNRVYKWIAMMLTAALLVGQCQVPALANEGTAPVETGVSDEHKDDMQTGGTDVTDKDAPEGDENDGGEGGEGEAGSDTGNGGTGEAGTSSGNGGDGSGETGSGNDGADDDGEDNPGAGGDETGDEGDNQGGEEGAPNKCVCETACTEDAVNEGCPVCAADYEACAKNAGGGVKPSEGIGEEETVSENDLDGEVGVALMAADEGMETYAADDTFWDDGSHLWYRVTGNGEVEVKGEDPDSDNRVANVIIPESFVKDEVTYRVTGIGANAFQKSWTLKTISIPASVERIGDNAFALSALSDVTIAEGVKEIGNSAFDSCFLNSITIPKSVRSIGERAFAHNEDLKSVTIPEGVAGIEKRTFDRCTRLTKVEIPGSVTSIGEGAFCDCSRLTSVRIPEGVTEIGELAFAGSGLTSAEIPQGVTCIETAVFEGCKSLTRVTIPESVTNIKRNVFYGCEGLTAIEIPQNVAQIGEAAFYKCKKLTGVEIPQGVTRIEQYTFASCSGLNNVVIPENVTNIGEGAFSDCSSLASVTISENISKIGVEAFKDCVRLKAFDIVVSSDVNIRFPQVGRDAFAPFPDNNEVNRRYIRFFDTFDTSKDELRGQAYTDAFKEAAQNDGDADNGRWYGWSYEGVTVDTYTVTINVKKDKNPWSGHSRTFALLGGGDSGFLEVPGQTGDSSYTISQVPNGTYHIYDITGVPVDSLYSRARDTGAEVRVNGADTEVDVTVNGTDVEKDVHYYTATFYDGTEAYKAGTPQEPQIILRGKKAAKPEDPQKADRQFAGWKTTDGGSTPYDFDTPVTDITSIFASWVEKTAEQLHITADATEGGTIDPTGDIAVTKGGEQSFTITPNEGYKIKTVTVDGKDVTAELKDTLARAQAGARYYTFTNVTENHTIHAAFEADSGDKPDDGGDDKPDDGDDKPDDDGDKPGGGGDKPDPGDDTPDGGGDNPAPDGDIPGGETGTAQVTVVSQASSLQDAVAPDSSAGNGGASATGQAAGGKKTPTGGGEPKTGDAAPTEIYATVAMIAGLTYLLLYFMEESRGMTEREKEVFVAAFIRWAKKGGRFRRCCAVAAIFCLLVYYHSIGKRAGRVGFDREYLRQAL